MVIRALRPTSEMCSLDSGFYNRLRRDVFPQVENIVPVVFQKGADNVFADVVYIPVYGSEDDFPFSRAAGRFSKVGIDLFKEALAASALMRSWGRNTVPFSKPWPTMSRAGTSMSLIIASGSVLSAKRRVTSADLSERPLVIARMRAVLSSCGSAACAVFSFLAVREAAKSPNASHWSSRSYRAQKLK